MNDTTLTDDLIAIEGPNAVQTSDGTPVDLASRIDMLIRAYAAVGANEANGATPSIPSAAPSREVEDYDDYDEPPLPELQQIKVLLIDDDAADAMKLERRLRQAGCLSVATTKVGRRALEVMLEQPPDLLLLDIKATDLRGLELLLLKRSVEALEHIPTLVMADAGRTPIKQQALRLGAADILSKPLDMVELVPRVRNVVVAAQREDQLAQERAQLEDLVHRRTYELEHSRQQLILSLARAAEHRDNETGNHVIRVGRFAGIIARELGWSEERAVMLEQAAQLHDVGKIGVPDDILFKPGKLDPDEYDLIKRHCAWGKDIIEPYSSREFQMLKSHARLGEAILHVRTSPMLMMASRIAQTHHENWDGTGYPLGLAGEDIPIEGRITAVADVFDALSSKRPYKDPFPREKCFAILREQRGTKFDPDVLDAFFRRADEVVEIQLDLMEDEL